MTASATSIPIACSKEEGGHRSAGVRDVPVNLGEPGQRWCDDFLAITEQQGRAIERLEGRVQRQENEAEKQRERITDQDEAIGWLLHRVRSLVSHIRKAGMEPPPAEPMSERARRYIHHIDA